MKIYAYTLLLLGLVTPHAYALKPMTDNEVKTMIIQGSVSAFQGDCPCPYSMHTIGDENARQNVQCGQDSAYFKNRANKPKCYPEDITPSDLNLYRAQYNIPGKVEGQQNLQSVP